MTRIAITGIGVVGPTGLGVDGFRALLHTGKTAVAPIERFDTTGLRSHNAATIAPFAAKDFIPAMKLRRMNLLSRYAVTAAKLALADAELQSLPWEGSEVGVAMGTAFGPVQTTVDYMREYVEKGASLAPPQLFAESVANAPGSHIAIELGLRGFNLTLTQRESSAMAAALYASLQIAKGAARAALIGGVDEVNEMLFSVLARVNALASGSNGLEEAARPFDARRNGMVVGEGGVVLIGEASKDADARSAKIYGYLAGFAVGRDATATTSDWGDDAAAMVRVMRSALEDAGVEPGQVDAIYASANSSIRGDRLEARAIRRLFGSAIPPVVASKGYFGEYAAAGGLQLTAALLGIRDQQVPASVGFERSEPGCELPLTGELRSMPIRNLLLNSASAGGGLISAVISKAAHE